MRLLKLWLPAFVGVLVTFTQASALPVPKLPPEATNKPSVVVRLRPVGELMKDAAYIAKMTGQQDQFDAFKPGMEPVLEVIDAQKPIGFYAKIGPQGIDSHGVLMVPVKNEKDAITLMNNLLGQIGVNVIEGKDGLHAINIPGAPFGVVMRYMNGYMYATVKNTPDAAEGLTLAKAYTPQALFTPGDDSLLSITLNADAIPNELKRKALSQLEKGLADFKNNEATREPNPDVRNAVATVVEEIAAKVQALIVDTQTMTGRIHFDRAKEEMALNLRVTARPDTVLASEIANLGSGGSLAAGIATSKSLASLTMNVAAPEAVKKALDPLVDQIVNEGWKKAEKEKQALAKDAIEALGPTIRAGILDSAIDIRGPNSDSHFTIVSAIRVKNGERLDAVLRKAIEKLPPDEKSAIKLDIAKSAGAALHQFPAKFDEGQRALVGPNANVVVAIGKDMIFLAAGPSADAIAAVKSSLETAAIPSPVLKGQLSMRRFATVLDRKDPGAVDAAKRAFPEGVDDTVRLNIAGGQNLDFRLSGSTRWFEFAMLMEKARRNR